MSYNSKYTGVEVENLLGKAGSALQEHQDISHLATKTELSKKQDTISDLATIRANAEKGATALQSVPSEYVTETELSGKGYATTSALSSGLSGKVDKDGSKVLSTNDFTNALKSKLEGLSNYDDTTISNAVNKLRTDFDTLVSGDTTTAIKTFNEVIAFLDGITDTQDLESIIASIEQQIAAKQDKISDLETIRQGAAKGATALQSFTETDPVFSASAAAGIKSSDISNWNSKTSNTGTITGIKMNGASKGTSGVVDLGTVITSHQDISGKLDASTAASTYLSKTDAASTYLGKTAKAASATTADSATKATQDASGNVITSTYATKSSVNAKQDAALKFENMSASTWVSDSTYEDFPYRCDIACSGVTSSMYAEVVFGVDEAISGDYAPMCETKSNMVSIWSAKNDTITVPTILITK